MPLSYLVMMLSEMFCECRIFSLSGRSSDFVICLVHGYSKSMPLVLLLDRKNNRERVIKKVLRTIAEKESRREGKKEEKVREIGKKF